MKDRTSEIWDDIIESGIATKEELFLVICINGYTEETLNKVIYARTGYRDIEQLKMEESDND